MKLIKPSLEYEASYRGYIDELGNEERYPFPLDFDFQNFPDMLKQIGRLTSDKTVEKGRIPSSSYWLVENDEIVGVSNLRHYLNRELEECGGHIGLSVRPSYRRKKLGVLLLNLTLKKAKEIGISQASIHCHTSNTASAKMIKACSGVFQSSAEVNGESISRYRIELTSV